MYATRFNASGGGIIIVLFGVYEKNNNNNKKNSNKTADVWPKNPDQLWAVR